MLSSLIVFAEATTNAVAAAPSAGGLSETVTKIAGDFGVTVPAVLAQVVNFSIVAAILWFAAFKPVMASIQERQEKIQAGLKYAEDMKAQLAAAQQESAVVIKNAHAEASRLIEESRRTAKEVVEKSQKEATDRANELIQKAQQAIELEHRKMLAETRSEIARLVVATTERVLSKRLSETDRAAYNEAAARELTSA
ncbi:MAG TPA: F0F1 ATP synthase subunit B [Opitutaceae bacterium]